MRRTRHTSSRRAPWPTNTGDPQKANGSSTINSLIGAASSGSAGNPTYIDVPDGVYRETVAFSTKVYLYLRAVNAGQVEIRATDIWSGWDNMGDGTWRSQLSVPPLAVDDSWQFEGITEITQDYPAGSNPTIINVASTAELSVGMMVLIGQNEVPSPENTHEFLRITDIGTNANGPTITLSRALTKNHYANPVNFGLGDSCVAKVSYALGFYPEMVYRNGPSERTGGKTLRRVEGTPGADDFALDSSRRVIIGANPSGHIMEVRTRNFCVTIAAPSTDITLDGLSCLYGGSYCVNADGSTRPTIRRCEVAYSHDNGCYVSGAINPTISHCRLHHNGHRGLHYNGNFSGAHLISVKGCKIDNNNPNLFSTSWNSAGLMLVNAQLASVVDCEVHDNDCHGIWVDQVIEEAQSCTIQRTRVHHNASQGVRFEGTHGNLMDGCAIYENGFHLEHDRITDDFNLSVVGSYDTTVENSIIAWGSVGSVKQESQTGAGRNDMHNVHMNNCVVVIEQKSGFHPWLTRWGDAGANPSPWLITQNNHNSGNRYAVTDASGNIIAEGTPGNRYRWANTPYALIASYNNTDGESGSTLLTQSELKEELTKWRIALKPEPF